MAMDREQVTGNEGLDRNIGWGSDQPLDEGIDRDVRRGSDQLADEGIGRDVGLLGDDEGEDADFAIDNPYSPTGQSAGGVLADTNLGEGGEIISEPPEDEDIIQASELEEQWDEQDEPPGGM